MKRAHSGQGSVLERRISELMIPPSAYRRVHEDEPAQRVLELLMRSLFPSGSAGGARYGHRSVLVYGRSGAFLGCLRLGDVLELVVLPGGEGACARSESGLLAARCRLLEEVTVRELLGEQRFVDVDAPLMEAVQLIVFDRLINIPVLRRGELVGILTDRDVLREISRHVRDARGSVRNRGRRGRVAGSLPAVPALAHAS